MTQMGSWLEWAGFGIGIGGLIASIAGLVFAFLARRAAKYAEAAADRASQETRRTVSRSRRTVETSKAVALINRLKVLHRNGAWAYVLELYQELRSSLSDIRASLPTETGELGEALREAILMIREIEDEVNRAHYESSAPADILQIDGILNDIQQNLEKLLSTDMHGL